MFYTNPLLQKSIQSDTNDVSMNTFKMVVF